MKKVVLFIFAALSVVILFYLLMFYTIYTLIGLAGVITAVGIYDIIQTRHAILRNFPVIGHFRYILEGIGPEIRQYFIESDTDGKPLNRMQRTYIYSRAKKENEKHPFGTEFDLQRDEIEWMRHSIYPSEKMHNPRVKIGGEKCTQPYEASIFNISAMSYGSLSKNAIMALNKGAKAGNFYHNSGEGSVSPYHQQGGDVVYQIGTGYFGCRGENCTFSEEKFKVTAALEVVKMIELKLSQGAKPGHGGILPASKNTPEIAGIRGVEPHTEVDSPPGHSAFSDAKGLLLFLDRLRELSNGKPVGFKLCVGSKDEFREICQEMVNTGSIPDFITVDGAEGGTGAAPIIFSDHVGMPWENAIVFVDNTLREFGLRDKLKVITAGKIIDGFDVFKALCLGADVCNSARGMMLALGCIQALECHSNTCPTGIATNNPSKVRGLVVEDKWKRVANYHEGVLKDFIDLCAAGGCKSLSDLNRAVIYKQVNGKEVSFDRLFPYSI